MGVLIEVHSGQGWKIGDLVTKLEYAFYNSIVARVFLRNSRKTECGAEQFLTRLVVRAAPFALFASFFMAWAFAAPPQNPPTSEKKLQTPGPKPEEQEPPEEDESLKPKEYTLNPLEAERNVTAGNFYFKKGNFRAAVRRFQEATRWDPSSGEAFLKLGESDEKIRDLTGAREAYTKYLDLAPDAKNAAEIRKKISKWPAPAAKK
jgi:tetratricopeptide (TPR) repeat protein